MKIRGKLCFFLSLAEATPIIDTVDTILPQAVAAPPRAPINLIAPTTQTECPQALLTPHDDDEDQNGQDHRPPWQEEK